MKKASLILTGDWHLRETIPTCRTDDFWGAQWKKVQFIKDLQKKHGCMVAHSGDLFDHWKASPFLLSKTIEHLPKDFGTVYGNHDLPQHRLSAKDKSAIYLLEQAGFLEVFGGYHWGEQLPREEDPLDSATLHFPNYQRNVLIAHVGTWMKEKPYPDCEDSDGTSLLKIYNQFDLILTGHFHTPFIAKNKNSVLVNPGGITRQTADESTFKPAVYLWYEEDNSVETVYLPIEKDVISREHIDKKTENDNRMQAFISRLNMDFGKEVSFEKNMEGFMKKNKIGKSVSEIIYKAMDVVE